MSVNVSAVQMTTDSGAAANFDRIIARPGLGPSAMIIEITESVLIDASDTVRKLFERYRQSGFGIAIDDFGVGYSSLAYLKNFDIDYLQIDRGLVSNLTERARDYAICEAVIAMAHKLGIRVIAEGVETEAQRALLAAAGCDFAQGYLYSRPLPASEFEATFFANRLRAAS
jgi:EAL domain-containing protein (putative c-di-GMP-specific phosphodiesterase class I)